MTDKVTERKGNIIRRLFDNELTREIARSLMDPDEVLVMKLEEVCAGCPARVSGSGSVEDCRRDYFGLLLQSYVGKAGEDEVSKLFALQKTCENCLSEYVTGGGTVQQAEDQ